MPRMTFYPVLTEPVLPPTLTAETVTESRWHQPLSEPQRRIAIPIALIAASGAVMAPTLPTPPSVAAWVQPLNQAIAQPFRPLGGETRPTPVIIPSTSWYQPLGTPATRQSVPQSTETRPPFVSTTIEWQQPLSAPLGARVKPPESGFSYSYFVAAAAGETVTLDKWYRPFAEPRPVAQPLPAGPFYVQAAPFAEAVSADRWYQPISQPLPRLRPPETGVFAYGYFVATATETITIDKWYRPLAEPAALRQALQSTEVRPPLIITPSFAWYQQLTQAAPKQPKPPEPALSYSYFVATPEGPVTLDKWYAALSLPRAPTKSFQFPTLSYSYTIITPPPASTAVYMRGFIVNVGRLTDQS